MKGLAKDFSIDEAYATCKAITESHYENFPVASVLLPAKVRRHVYPIYAFARHADDLADEDADKEGLLEWQKMLHQAVNGKPDHPVFIALKETIHTFSLPLELFDNLISAFLQDLEQTRYTTIENLFDYCSRSANPVGRLILRLHGYTSNELFRYSDHICTALQLANFWQDVSVDINKERIYIPQDLLRHFGVSEQDIIDGKNSNDSRKLAMELVNNTRREFRKGIPLLKNIGGRLKLELMFTVAGGISILDKIKKNSYDMVSVRPTLSKWDWLKIAGQLTLNRHWYDEHTN